MHPLSTRTGTCRHLGLRAALEELGRFESPGVVLEADRKVGSLEHAAAYLDLAGARVLGVVGPLAGDAAPEGGWPRLASGDAEERRRALDLLAATLPLLARHRCQRLIVPVGAAGLPGQTELEARLAVPGADAAAEVARLLDAQRQARARAAERLCRALDALARLESQVQLLVLPGSHPAGILDTESTGWVLDDLRGRNVGLALDTGLLGLRAARGGEPLETWWDKLPTRLGLVFLADHNGTTRGNLLPGMGTLDFQGLRSVLDRATPRVLRPDPELPAAFIPEAERVLTDRLRSAPER